MHFVVNNLAGGVALLLSTVAVAQTQPPAQKKPSMTVQQVPMPGTTAKPATTTAPATPATPGAAPASPVASASTQTQTQTAGTAATQAATAADVKAGVPVYDTNGGAVGKIESVIGADAVIDTGDTRPKIPISSFAKNEKGLIISMTKAELDAAAKKAAPQKTSSKPG
jgi:hypothetical protein